MKVRLLERIKNAEKGGIKLQLHMIIWETNQPP